jgi:hypothetical protein
MLAKFDDHDFTAGKQHAVLDGTVVATDGSQSAREPNAPSPDLIADVYEDSPIVEWTPAESSGDLNHNVNPQLIIIICAFV